MWKTLPVLRHTIKFMANNDIIFNTQCFKVADLGCSSSINSLLVASTIIDMVHDLCEETKHKSPQFEVCLNDLFGNDFNTIFKMLPEFYSNLKKKKKKREHFGHCFVSATPGSFYRRLFPNKSLHLIHSMYALHWLSQVIFITSTFPVLTIYFHIYEIKSPYILKVFIQYQKPPKHYIVVFKLIGVRF